MRYVWLGRVAAIAAVLIAGTSADPDGALAAKGKCNTPKTAYRTEGGAVATTSSSYVVVPKSRIDFTQGGNKAGCVVVRFSAIPDAFYIVMLRAVIDGTIVADPGEIQFDYQSPSYLAPRSFEFVFPKIAPGDHVLRLEWRVPSVPDAKFYSRTITVQHR